jgi:hypothetical protein
MTRSLRRQALRRGLVPFGANVRLSDLSPDRFPRADGNVRANRSTRPWVFVQAALVSLRTMSGCTASWFIDGGTRGDVGGRNRAGEASIGQTFAEPIGWEGKLMEESDEQCCGE